MNKSKHDAVWTWLQGCPHVRDLFFNLVDAEAGATKLVPSESIAAEYTDGSSLRHYDCALTRFEPCSIEPNDTMNIESLEAFEALGAWIENRAADGDYPAFPEGETAQDITVFANESGFMAAEDMNICKFMMQFRIEYLKEKKG